MGLDLDELEATLAEIDAGMPDGQRYSNRSASKDRRRPSLRQVSPHLTQGQCREIIRALLKRGVLREETMMTRLPGSKEKGCAENPEINLKTPGRR